MSDPDLIVDGKVLFCSRGVAQVEVSIEGTKHIVTAKRAGKLQMRRTIIMVGDFVRVQLNEVDPSRGRITERHEKG